LSTFTLRRYSPAAAAAVGRCLINSVTESITQSVWLGTAITMSAFGTEEQNFRFSLYDVGSRLIPQDMFHYGVSVSEYFVSQSTINLAQ
jgi:hypothetical protein